MLDRLPMLEQRRDNLDAEDRSTSAVPTVVGRIFNLALLAQR